MHPLARSTGAALACLLCSATALAAEPVSGLVLETHGEARPGGTDEILGPVLAELEARGFAARPDQAREMIEARFSRSGRSGAVSIDALRDRITAGYRLYLTGKFAAAVLELRRALGVIHANPGVMVLHQPMQSFHMRALVGLALGERRLGREREAAAVMAELVRTFPGAEISSREYGPEAVELYTRVQADLRKEGSGRLVVETRDQSAVIFVNESFRGVVRIAISLPAGSYRVCVQRGKEVGRVHDVSVERDRESLLVVDSGLDAAIRTEAGWTGLALSDQPGAEARAIEHGAEIGRAVGVKQVVLLGVRSGEEGPRLVGTVVGVKAGRAIRQASLSLSPPPSEPARAALGRFLAGGDATEELVVSIQEGKTDRAEQPEPGVAEAAFSPAWKWVMAGGAVASVGTGIFFLGLNGSCRGTERQGECPEVWTTAKHGWAAIGVGGALGMMAGYLFWRERRDERVQIGLAPSSAGVRVWAGLEF